MGIGSHQEILPGVFLTSRGNGSHQEILTGVFLTSRGNGSHQEFLTGVDQGNHENKMAVMFIRQNNVTDNFS